jgi:hypothetical protein
MMTIRPSQMKSMAKASPNTAMIVPCEQHWIEFQLVDEDGEPVPNEKYKITLPDSSIHEGVLDDEGKVRFDGIVGGKAEITFPDIDGREWSARQAAGH